MAEQLINIDGGMLEGGGQILRIAVAFSILTKKNIRIFNIRKGRAKGGLRPQHLKGVQLVCDMCDGKLQGDYEGSTEITFFPGSSIKSGFRQCDTETAGSVTLLFQTSLPVAMFSTNTTTLQLKGGTDVPFSPPIDYVENVLLPIISKFGVHCNYELLRRGYYPKGGGVLNMRVSPTKKLNPVQLLSFGSVISIRGVSLVSSSLPIQIARDMADAAKRILEYSLQLTDVYIGIDVIKLTAEEAVGYGSSIILFAETDTGCIVGASRLGDKSKSAKVFGQEAAKELAEYITKQICIDNYTQDQILFLMALAGSSAVKCDQVTNHTKTAIYTLQQLTSASFKIIPQPDGTNIIESTKSIIDDIVYK